MREPIGHFLDACAGAQSVGHLWRAALRFAASRDVPFVHYRAVGGWADALLNRRGHAHRNHGYPRAWAIAFYRNRWDRDDPSVPLATALGRPFLWRDIPALTDLTRAQRAVIEGAAAVGVRDGLSFRVHGPRGRHGYVGLGFGAEPRQPEPGEIFEIYAAAQMAHLRLLELVPDTREPLGDLSAREREVLQWLVRGLSNAAIAREIGVSAHTVDTLVRRIFAKLGVRDRTTAAVRAVEAGLVRSG
ncbi:LuxR family transcriptional regulator [Jannaschia sp. W003]|uniref:helix-turn-helix transcriptional regulator n=1 Tax=Jannaschia sp. W003 TaxID=2867012 RepID=UPI0021A73E4E|nr:LuxR family transcriptional regulator [Jannaschia sp. W003]UWQ20709.1 LuxR family transcriptional regulator [Jannaschia sp. W003]